MENEANKKYLSVPKKRAYGSGDFESNFFYMLVSSFMMLYLTDSVGLNAGVVGTLMMVSKLLDGVTDVFFGSLIDKTHSKMGKARPWMFFSAIPLAYFGEGKNYTEFTYSDLSVTEETDSRGKVDVFCTVTNAGKRDGEEVVQLYLTDEVASMIRPAKELAGFCRVFIKAGESKRIHFSMNTDQTAFLDSHMQWIVEAGEITVGVGGSSEEIQLTGKFVITDTAVIDGKTRGFYAKSNIVD